MRENLKNYKYKRYNGRKCFKCYENNSLYFGNCWKINPSISLATNTLDMGLFARNALIDSLNNGHENELKTMLKLSGEMLGGKSKRKKIIFNKTQRKKR